MRVDAGDLVLNAAHHGGDKITVPLRRRLTVIPCLGDLRIEGRTVLRVPTDKFRIKSIPMVTDIADSHIIELLCGRNRTLQDLDLLVLLLVVRLLIKEEF